MAVRMDTSKILLNQGLLTADQLEQVSRASRNGDRIDQTAIAMGLLSETDALHALGAELGLASIDLETAEIDTTLLSQFPQNLIHRHTIFPVCRRDGVILVATSDPLELYPMDEASTAMGCPVEPVLAIRQKIVARTTEHLGVGSETIEGLLAQRQEDELELLDAIATDDSELAEESQEASVVRLVNEILVEAIDARASDVHIESQGSGIKIRYRIDGQLHTQPMPAEIHQFQSAIISRLKIMARLNIAEKRLPQDGRIKLRFHNREVDVRVSIMPTIHGESVVMRLLDRQAMEISLENIGLERDLRQQFEELIRLPHGIILVTGPTGSGKTTTLYSALMGIQNEYTKIITTEDPVEYQLEGISQIQVHPKIGLTFANSLRSILRHDPDVVLVGEIRDSETAENAIQASLTGHLVFSTLHTNDAPSAFARLTDMGIEPFLVASTIEAVLAQRLVRTLCLDCREPYSPQREDVPPDFPWAEYELGGQPIYRERGCRNCREIGFSGRQGIFELCPTTDAIRQLAHDGASIWEVRKAAIAGGMRTLRQDAWLKVLAGTTTMEEVIRVSKGDHA
jgi:general secretion pathway protein E